MSALRTIRNIALLLALVFAAVPAFAADHPAPCYKAVAFDYLTIFNPDSVVAPVEKELPGRGEAFVKLWREKQFDYAHLRALSGHYEDFDKVTRDALIYTADSMGIRLTPAVQQTFIHAYHAMQPWPEAVAALRKLKAGGVRLIVLSTFTAPTLRDNAENAGIADLFEALVSTDSNHTYKPDPKAYALGVKALKLKKREILFVASSSWDAYGATSFGYPTYWINRTGALPDELGVKPTLIAKDLDGMVDSMLGECGK